MAEGESSDPARRLIDVGHLSSGVGHHVINAFSAIVSNAELLRLKPLSPHSVTDPALLADTIITTALEAATVARLLIDYARPITSIEPDTAAFEPRTVRLDQLAAEVVSAERAKAPGSTVWETDFEPARPVLGHRAQLASMLGYLFANAHDALPPSGGTIRVSTSTEERGWIAVEVADTAKG